MTGLDGGAMPSNTVHTRPCANVHNDASSIRCRIPISDADRKGLDAISDAWQHQGELAVSFWTKAKPAGLTPEGAFCPGIWLYSSVAPPALLLGLWAYQCEDGLLSWWPLGFERGLCIDVCTCACVRGYQTMRGYSHVNRCVDTII